MAVNLKYGQRHAVEVLEELGTEVVPLFPKQGQRAAAIGSTGAEEFPALCRLVSAGKRVCCAVGEKGWQRWGCSSDAREKTPLDRKREYEQNVLESLRNPSIAGRVEACQNDISKC